MLNVLDQLCAKDRNQLLIAFPLSQAGTDSIMIPDSCPNKKKHPAQALEIIRRKKNLKNLAVKTVKLHICEGEKYNYS